MHPLLRDFRDECNAVLVRLLAYASGVALLALIAADIFIHRNDTPIAALPPAAKEWTRSVRPHPAFSLPLAELDAKTNTYEIYRHPEGGRRDVLTWAEAETMPPFARLEIYRPGAERAEFGPDSQELEARLPSGPLTAVDPAGVIASKLGPVQLSGFTLGEGAGGQRCLGFVKQFGAPRAALIGWFCQSGAAPRALVACALDRLTLLSAGGDSKLAELFARADLRRGQCSSTGQAVAALDAQDWITASNEPALRGALKRD